MGAIVLAALLAAGAAAPPSALQAAEIAIGSSPSRSTPDEAINAQSPGSQWDEVYQARDAYGQAHSEGRYQDALKHALKRRDLLAALGEGATLDFARAELDCGEVYHALGLYEEARRSLERSAALYAQTQGPEDAKTLVALTTLAVVEVDAGRPKIAEDLSRRVLAIRQKTLGPDHPYTAISLNNLGLSLSKQGKRQEAEIYYQKALNIWENTPDAGSYVPVGLHNLAGVVSDRETLIRLRRRSLALTEEMYGPDHPAVISGINALAGVLGDDRTSSEASTLYERVVTIRKAQLGADHLSTADAHAELGALLAFQKKNPEMAEAHLSAALSIYQRKPERHRRSIARIENSLAGVARQRKQYAQALAHHDAALTASKGNGADLRTQVIHQAHKVYTLLEMRDLKLLIAARQSLIDARRSNAQTGPIRSGDGATLIGNTAVAFTRAAWTTSGAKADPGLLGEVFLAIQEARLSEAGASLRRNIMRSALDQAGQAQLRRLDDLVRARDALRARQAASAGGQNVESRQTRDVLSDRQAGLDREIRAIRQSFQAAHPEFEAALAQQPLSLMELRRRELLRPNEALILLTPGDTRFPAAQHRGIVMVVTREDQAWAELPLEPDALDGEITRLREQLDRPTGPFDASVSRRLYRTLFVNPAISRLAGAKTDWIIVPQGRLMSLPFSALATGKVLPRGIDRPTGWLGQDRALSILPDVESLQLLRGASEKTSLATRPFIGIGDPAFTGVLPVEIGKAYFRDAQSDLTSLRGLAPLKGARAELQALAGLLGATSEDLYLGPDANERRLRDLNAGGHLGQARVIALATHGLIAGDLGGALAEPALALTPPDDPDPMDDGLLTASEAASLRLNADWVILSACNTAVGGRGNAEGLSGLAQGFFHAGARSLLVSHWRLRDDAAVQLTNLTVRHAAGANVPKAEALRLSMRQVASSPGMQHPNAWAAFFMVGVEP